MEVTRYVNEKQQEGALPPLFVKNQGILEVFHCFMREKHSEIRENQLESEKKQ